MRLTPVLLPDATQFLVSLQSNLMPLKSISVYNVNDITAVIIKKLKDKTQDKLLIKYHPKTIKICCDQIRRHFKLLTYKFISMINDKT
jgi:hypothetical protein